MDHLRLEMFIFLDEAGQVEKHVGTLEIMYVKARMVVSPSKYQTSFL